jgi:hypothetical protein
MAVSIILVTKTFLFILSLGVIVGVLANESNKTKELSK